MVIDLIKYIAESLYQKNNTFFDTYAYLCRKDKNIVTVKTQRSVTYKGITDNNGSYFYIRTLQEHDIEYKPGMNYGQRSAEQTVQLRLVVVSNRFDEWQLEQKLKNDILLMNYKAYTGTETKISLNLNRSSLDSQRVFEAETGTDKFTGKIQLISFDLELNFTYISNPCLQAVC